MKIGVASRDGLPVAIDQVERGLQCWCLCLGCGAQLVARKGGCRIAHFARFNGLGNPSCSETAAHRLAKSILEQERKLWLPPVYKQIFDRDPMIPGQEVC